MRYLYRANVRTAVKSLAELAKYALNLAMDCFLVQVLVMGKGLPHIVGLPMYMLFSAVQSDGRALLLTTFGIIFCLRFFERENFSIR